MKFAFCIQVRSMRLFSSRKSPYPMVFSIYMDIGLVPMTVFGLPHAKKS